LTYIQFKFYLPKLNTFIVDIKPMETRSQESIEKVILENYGEYQYLFTEFQSKFLSDLSFRYRSVENGNLVLYYAREVHQNILRQKDYNLNFNISFEKFWDNHSTTDPTQKSLSKVGEDTFLPKETVRRKILHLIKQKVLNKKKKNIRWLPSEKYKQSYNLDIDKEISDVCKLISFICKKANILISKDDVVKEIKERFSFYWFHYLGAQLEYLKLWSKQFKDLELVLIFLQVAHLFTSKEKNFSFSHKTLYDDPSFIKEFISASISATFVAEVTGIPRATCIRKLNTLVELKIIAQDKILKRYYLIPEAMSENLVSKKITGEAVKIFSNFFFICIRATGVKT
jgi:hypothetical protein